MIHLLLFNEVNIFATEAKNYANDRLAIFLFENSFAFLSNWTNLQFYSLPPLQTVEKYFELNPDQCEPIWAVN